jgi:hypothetical protein
MGQKRGKREHICKGEECQNANDREKFMITAEDEAEFWEGEKN